MFRISAQARQLFQHAKVEDVLVSRLESQIPEPAAAYMKAAIDAIRSDLPAQGPTNVKDLDELIRKETRELERLQTIRAAQSAAISVTQVLERKASARAAELLRPERDAIAAEHSAAFLRASAAFEQAHISCSCAPLSNEIPDSGSAGATASGSTARISSTNATHCC
jgi:hypothetical protein